MKCVYLCVKAYDPETADLAESLAVCGFLNFADF